MNAATTTSRMSLLRTPLRARMRSLVRSLRRVRGRPGATGDGMLWTIGARPGLRRFRRIHQLSEGKLARKLLTPSGTAERRRGEDRGPALSRRDWRGGAPLLLAPTRGLLIGKPGFRWPPGASPHPPFVASP